MAARKCPKNGPKKDGSGRRNGNGSGKNRPKGGRGGKRK